MVIFIVAVMNLIASQIIGLAQACGFGPSLSVTVCCLLSLQFESLFELYFYKVTVVFSLPRHCWHLRCNALLRRVWQGVVQIIGRYLAASLTTH